ncbi:FtsJ-like methyltransferase-domain-containing protein [Baffinella frigidus]|nr:FtsJ-like methyltransferase-domain-containing protein [Cryptophyta sp. CCMP2293]
MPWQLDEKDIRVWKDHTKKTLISGVDAVNEVRDKYGAEMGTRAWLKMYEMIAAFDLIDCQVVQGGECNSLHLCEAPGAFICATNHYIRTRWPNMRWNWMGCTLNPYFEGGDTDAMVEDDAFINDTRGNWYFGKDNSGDMRLPVNIEGTWERARAMGPVHLVTADGSIDCSGTPNQQEEVVAQLHFCEAVGAMGALAKGGAFVLKMFTLFEHSSICLLYILKCFFETVTVNKPIMSTPGNGETYVISKGFKGISQEHLQQLLEHCGTQWPSREFDGAALSLVSREHIGNSWLASLQEGAAYFGRLQGSVITRNLRLFENSFSTADGQAVRVARQLVVGEWTRRFRIMPINPAHKIVAHSKAIDPR